MGAFEFRNQTKMGAFKQLTQIETEVIMTMIIYECPINTKIHRSLYL